MSYATIAQLREYLQQVKAGAERDAELQTVLDRAHAIAASLVGFTFAAWPDTASEQDVECGHGGRWLEIGAHKAGSVTAVALVSGRGAAGETTDEVSDWLEEDDGRLYLDGGWSPGWYRVTAIWGYGPAPADAVQLDLQIAINIWRGRDASDFAGVVGVEGQGATAYNRAVTWSERNLADGIRAKYLGVVHA